MSNTRKIIHTTANGKVFNMDQLREKNELTTAAGNIYVNARGDELGPGGKIIRKRSEILDSFYKDQTKEEEYPVSIDNSKKESDSSTLNKRSIKTDEQQVNSNKNKSKTQTTNSSTATKTPSKDKGASSDDNLSASSSTNASKTTNTTKTDYTSTTNTNSTVRSK